MSSNSQTRKPVVPARVIGSQLYRVFINSREVVGAIVAISKQSAVAYALGAYGPGADVEPVAVTEALEAFGVCVVVSTAEKEIRGATSLEGRRVRVIKN